VKEPITLNTGEPHELISLERKIDPWPDLDVIRGLHGSHVNLSS
jgi:hypothetical protein